MEEREWIARLQDGPCRLPLLYGQDEQAQVSARARLQGMQRDGIDLVSDADGMTWALGAVPDLIDAQQLAAALPAGVSAQLASLAVRWQVESTNASLLALPPDQADGIHVLLAEGQLAGRGRRGRRWQSPLATHIYLSVSWPFPQGLRAMAGLSIAVGVMVADALARAGLEGVGLKWPNDLVTAHGKLGGILVESAGTGRGAARAVIGIGLNVHPGPAAAAAAIDQPWDCLDRLAGTPLRRGQVASWLLAGLLPGLEHFALHGLAGFMDGYTRWDVLAGKPIWLDNGQHERVPATALGLAPDGSLRVRQGSLECCVHAGEVSVRQQ